MSFMSIFKLLVVFIWSLTSTGVNTTAQTRTAIEPCIFETCKCYEAVSNRSMEIKCVNENMSEATPNYFPKRANVTVRLNISELRIEKYDFAQIPDDAFQGLSIERLWLYNNNLKTLTRNALRGIVNLENLAIGRYSNFEGLEAGAFDPIAKTLTVLSLSNLWMDDEKFIAASIEIRKLEKISWLIFDGNRITRIGPDHFKDLTSLRSFSINFNQLLEIDTTAFSRNSSLSSFEASSNNLTNPKQVFDALKHAGLSRFGSIDLSRNQIKSLAFNSSLSTLSYLYLSYNLIESVDNRSLSGLYDVGYVDLSNNKINSMGEAEFLKMVFLKLVLSGNYLTEVPSILKYPRIGGIDLSWQNGQLKSIRDNAFERKSAYNSIEVFLNGNDIEVFGTQAFCAKSSVPSFISPITLSYNTMKAIPKCVLKQLSLKPTSDLTRIIVEEPNESTANISDVCNCDLLSFSLIHGLNITGACEEVFNTLTCNHSGYQDPCVNQTQYKCAASFTTTSTTSTSTPSITTSSSDRVTLLKPLSSLSILILFVPWVY